MLDFEMVLFEFIKEVFAIFLHDATLKSIDQYFVGIDALAGLLQGIWH